MLKTFCHLHDEEGIFRFYVGGALGVDMWAAEQLLYLKEQPGYQDIELIVALPFEGHDSKWDAMSKQRLQIIIHNATKCIVIGQSGTTSDYKKRNYYMVDHADFLLAVYDSIAILCEKVGISKTFFYSFFSSKEELVMQALRYQQPKLLRYAQELMNDPKLSWRESVKTFLKNCCYGEKVGFAVLSIEEEQQVYRCLSNENFQAFRNDQLYLYRNLLTIFGVPMDNIDPRLFGNLSLTMMMSYKAIPDTMPFLFPEVADDMVEFQINALLDEMQRAKKEAIR